MCALNMIEITYFNFIPMLIETEKALTKTMKKLS
ncbi:hypothetical protein FPSM_01262 [Flavobacterium psychrophilum]|nr:hypothetical protein FPSM_01262 [Flavobacterium psychrophilum]